jgi:hypothetical protein
MREGQKYNKLLKNGQYSANDLQMITCNAVSITIAAKAS